MAIALNNEFTVKSSPDETYALLVDVERVAPCIPGAEMTGANAEGGHDATMTVRVGPMKLAFSGSVKIVEQDERARRAVMVAKGREQRGQGTAQAEMQMSVEDAAGASRVTIGTDVQVAGKLAQIGSGVMADVAGRMISEMARCVEATLQAAPATEAPPAGTSRGAGVATDTAAAPPQRPPVRAATPSAGSLILHVLVGRIRSLWNRLAELVRRRRQARSGG